MHAFPKKNKITMLNGTEIQLTVDTDVGDGGNWIYINKLIFCQCVITYVFLSYVKLILMYQICILVTIYQHFFLLSLLFAVSATW